MLKEDIKKTFRMTKENLSQGDFVRNVLSTFFVNVISLFLSIFTAAIVSRFLGPEGKGLLSVVLLVPGLLVTFLNAGIGVSNVYFVGSRRLSVETLVSNSMTMAGIGTFVGVGIIIILWVTKFMERLIPDVPIGLIWLATTVFPFGLLNCHFSAIFQGLQRITFINAINLLQTGATLILTLLFVISFGYGVIGALLAILIASSLAFIGLIYPLICQGIILIPKWDNMVVYRTLSFGLKGHIGNIFQFLNYRLDMFFVNYFLGLAGVGIYSVSVGLAELLWYFPNAVGFVIFTKSASMKPEMMNIFTPRVFKITLGLTSLGAVGLIFIGKPIISFIYSSTFLPAYVPMLILLPGVVLLGGGKVLTNEIAGRGYPHYNSINSGFSLIFTVILDLVLIPRYQILGAALASTISYSISFFVATGFYLIISRKEDTLKESKIIIEGTNVSSPMF